MDMPEERRKQVFRPGVVFEGGLGFGVEGLGLHGFWFRVWELEFRIEGLGFRVLGFGIESLGFGANRGFGGLWMLWRRG